MSDIDVQFGASTEDLKEGVGQAKEAIGEFAEMAKTAGELLGVALSIEAVKSFVESMADLGTQAERTAAMLGTTIEQVGELNAIALATGSSEDGMSVAMQRLAMNMQRAQTGTGPAAQAFKALNLNAKEMSQLPLTDVIGKIADKFAQWGDGINKTAIAMALMGRSGAQMIPVLDQGSAGIDRLGQMADRAGTAMSEQTAKGFHDLHESLTEAQLSLQGIGITLGTEFLSALQDAVKATISSEQEFNNWLKSSGDLKTLFSSAAGLVKELTSDLNDLANALGLADSKTFDFKQDIKDLTRIIDAVTGGARELRALLSGGFAEMDKVAVSATGVYQTHQMMLDFDHLLATREKLGGSKPLELTVTPKKPQAPSIADNKDAISAQIEFYTTAIKLRDDYYASSVERINALAKAGKIGEAQKTADLTAAVNAREKEEVGTLNAELSIGNLSVAQRRKVEDEISLIHAKAEKDRQKITDDAMVANVKAWESAIKPIQSAWDSQLKGLLSGTTTFAQAMKNIVSDLVLEMIKKFEELAIIKPMIQALSSAFDLSSMAASVMKMITSLAGPIFAGVTANVAPETGPAAPAVGAAVAAGAMATAKGLSSLDAGTWSVPRDMTADIHEGEMVVPRFDSDLFRAAVGGGGGGGGGATHNWNVTAIDARSFAQALNDHSSVLYKQIQQGMRNAALKPA